MLRIPTLGRRGLVNGLMQAGGKLFDFYVDSVNGDDGNDGKSAITAYKTISALTGQITAGTRIGLARGSTWLEQLNLTENNVVVRAYGTGCILSAAGAVVRTTNITGYVFTSNGTRYTCVTSHYYTPATFTYAGDNNIFVNGAVGTKFNINGTAENFAAWQARVTPHDANSTTPAA